MHPDGVFKLNPEIILKTSVLLVLN
jgi:hypothetical protein